MIGFALALLSAPPVIADTTPPAATEIDREIVVIGRSLARWKGLITTKNGEMRCKTTRTTKDAEVDAIGCAAMLGCVVAIKPEMDAIAELENIRPSDRKRRLQEKAQSVGPCMVERRDAGIAMLARNRAGL